MPGPRKGFAKPKNAKGTLLRLLGYLKKYKVTLVLVAFFLILSSVANVAGTYLLKPLFNTITEMAAEGNRDMRPLLTTIAALGVIYTLGIAGTYTANRLLLNVSTDVLHTVRCDMFRSLEKLPLRYYDTRTHGETMSRFTNDTDTLREMVSSGLPQILTSSITIVGVFLMMMILSPLLTALVIVMIFLMMGLVSFIMKRSAHFFIRRQQALAACNGYIEELMEGQREVKVFCHEQAVEERMQQLAGQLRKDSTAANGFAMVMMPMMGNLSHVLYAICAASGAGLAIGGFLDIGSIASFLTYTRQFTNPITQISQQAAGILNALAGAERIFELIDETPEVDEGNVTLVFASHKEDGSLEEAPAYTGIWAWKVPEEDGSNLVELKGDVRFHDVTFAYEEGHDILKNLSLYACPGQKIAFVGSTGAGKTTITNLINRFYDVQGGRITYDGIDVKEIRKADLRRSLSMVLQDTHLFTGTVRENIRYGNLYATDAEVEQAARLANAHHFISHLPQGYDTMLTADGANLSQGQRQLIAIARAAVAHAPVLILDEATSSIDTRTERLIEKGLDSLMAGRTVFVIAHRLSTVRNSDAIMVLEHGSIIERGDHNDLIAQHGKYYQLYMGMFELS